MPAEVAKSLRVKLDVKVNPGDELVHVWAPGYSPPTTMSEYVERREGALQHAKDRLKSLSDHNQRSASVATAVKILSEYLDRVGSKLESLKYGYIAK